VRGRDEEWNLPIVQIIPLKKFRWWRKPCVFFSLIAIANSILKKYHPKFYPGIQPSYPPSRFHAFTSQEDLWKALALEGIGPLLR